MSSISPVSLISDTAVIWALVIGSVVYLIAKFFTAKGKEGDRIAKDTLDNLTTTVEALKTQNALQAGQIKEHDTYRQKVDKQYSELTGKVNTLSTIPLAKIEKHMADTNKILTALIPLIPASLEETVVTRKTTKKVKEA